MYLYERYQKDYQLKSLDMFDWGSPYYIDISGSNVIKFWAIFLISIEF